MINHAEQIYKQLEDIKDYKKQILAELEGVKKEQSVLQADLDVVQADIKNWQAKKINFELEYRLCVYRISWFILIRSWSSDRLSSRDLWPRRRNSKFSYNDLIMRCFTFDSEFLA